MKKKDVYILICIFSFVGTFILHLFSSSASGSPAKDLAPYLFRYGMYGFAIATFISTMLLHKVKRDEYTTLGMDKRTSKSILLKSLLQSYTLIFIIFLFRDGPDMLTGNMEMIQIFTIFFLAVSLSPVCSYFLFRSAIKKEWTKKENTPKTNADGKQN